MTYLYKLKRVPATVILLLLALTVFSQNMKTVQPKIMVVPKLKANENYKQIYDSSTNVRVAIAKINEALLKQGANIVSFDAKIKEYESNRLLNRESGNEEDYKSKILQLSACDIYVEVEVNKVRHTELRANSVAVILEAYQNGTGNYLGVKEGRSRINQTDDIGLLTAHAMDTITTSFLNLVQQKFDDITVNGQSIFVQFTIAPSSKYTFESEIGSEQKLLSEIVDEWFQKNCVNGVYNNQGVVSSTLIISDARIPLKDPTNPQNNYSGQKFFTAINKFFKSLGMPVKREIGNNNKILITIQ